MDTILLTTFLNGLFFNENYSILLKFDWKLPAMVNYIITQHGLDNA